MTVKFNIDEIIDIACQLERNGENFYRKAAILYPDHSKFLLELAEQEVVHEQRFKDMKARFVQNPTSYENDSDNISQLYLNAIADGTIFKKGKVEEEFSDIKTFDDVVKKAIKREQQTILFFLGFKEIVQQQSDQQIIDEMIKEEMSHIAWLKSNR